MDQDTKRELRKESGLTAERKVCLFRKRLEREKREAGNSL
jgi:hypothetical protein